MQASDVYAFATVAWYLFSRGDEFFEQNLGSFYWAVVKRKGRPEFRSDVNTSLVALLQSCWQAKSGQRPNFVGILHELDKLYSEAV